MKTFKVKNYKGNLVESLSKFQKSHKGMKIVEAVEDDEELKIKAEPEAVKEASSTEDIAIEKGNKFFDMLARALTMVFTEDVDSVEDFGTWKEFLNYIKKSQLAITPSSDYNKKFEQAFKEFENAVNSL